MNLGGSKTYGSGYSSGSRSGTLVKIYFTHLSVILIHVADYSIKIFQEKGSQLKYITNFEALYVVVPH
jgi:hypothetical protein